MPDTSMETQLHRTPFHQFHIDHGAKMVDFAGWEMPILYTSIHEEHHRVRTNAGLFDVSHMGRFKISGRDARKLLEQTLTRRVGDMTQGACRYSLVCNDQGGVLDDILVYCFEYDWLLVVNACNRKKILTHLETTATNMAVKIVDQTTTTAMVALQGPKVMEQIAKFSREVPTLKRYRFCVKSIMILKMTISRTGYTGEDGVEIILPASTANMAIKLLLRDAKTDDLQHDAILPAGLGARDTLRMEAAMPLYGHELDETIDPLSAGLGFAVSLDKDEHENGEPFIGQAALKKIAADGPAKRLIGLKLEGKRTARQGMPIYKSGKEVGKITSACLSPTLGAPIAMAYADAGTLNEGDTANINLGSKHADAKIVALPFYKRT